MGIDLTITEESMKSVLTNHRAAILAALKTERDGRVTNSPNLFRNDAIAAALSLQGYGTGLPGGQNLERALIDLDDAGAEIYLAVTEQPESECVNLDSVVSRYFKAIGTIAGFLAGLREGNTQHISDALTMLILNANRFYSPETAEEFLKHVKGGNIDQAYSDKLRNGSRIGYVIRKAC